ncbi:M48 family metallopeptidase [Candidatus Vampirococcus lugosii]|uniref:Metal-dependent hydrolase n=1 Tax=Candidatus Vampirococcus lugosii TaxID=2789015 RepID=A0ABS5QMS0_9BACT|nr:SprT family zinc-dependent metalloprotease [Candidatus Vampirococcus lugosii]MBS8122501.1 metal-dependent hydrolase [Candidatus Vampirococcus lugosii]
MNLNYEIIKSKRKTICVTIERNNNIIIKAPNQASDEQIKDFFDKKQLWIYTKLEEKKCLSYSFKNREFVNGEGFYYLGRMYKLKLVENVDFQLRFYKNSFELNKKYIFNGKKIFVERYKKRFNKKIFPRVKLLAEENGFEINKISIKDLGNRWGSCTSNNNINFHWKIMLAPVSVIEYIIIHELCHTKEKNHSPKFWDLVYKYMPDYQNHKEWLKRNGGELVL